MSVHWIQVFFSPKAFLVIQSSAARKMLGWGGIVAWPPSSSRTSLTFLRHVEALPKTLAESRLMLTIFADRPYFLRIFHRKPLSIKSNAFSKSTKTMYSCVFYSWLCSTIILDVAIWSPQDLLFLKPVCSSLSCFSTAFEMRSRMILHKILLVIGSSIMLLQFLHCIKLPSLGSCIRIPCSQSSGNLFISPYLVQEAIGSFL